VEGSYSLDDVESVKDFLPVIRFEVVKTLLELQLRISERFIRGIVSCLSYTKRRWKCTH
jgi:hypothetical protein